MTDDRDFRRLHYRAWHRGTREADFVVGGFFDRFHAGWSEADIAWFERLLDEQDADIMAWVTGLLPPPADYAGAMLDAFLALDFVELPK